MKVLVSEVQVNTTARAPFYNRKIFSLDVINSILNFLFYIMLYDLYPLFIYYDFNYTL